MMTSVQTSTKRAKGVPKTVYADTRIADNVLINMFLDANDAGTRNLAWSLFWDGEKDKEDTGYKAMCHSFVRGFGVLGYDDGEDAVSEVRDKVLRHLKNFDQSTPFIPWLKSITRNHCKNITKRNRNRKTESVGNSCDASGKTSSAAHAYHNTPTKAKNPREVVLSTEQRMQVIAALDELEGKEREIIMCYYFEDMAYKEIAEALGIPIGTVMSRLHNAKGKFKDIFVAINEED